MIRTLLAAAIATIATATPANATEVIAHRAGTYPAISPSSMGAVARTQQLGVTSFEIDVQSTKSDTLVAMHDTTVDATTPGTGALINMTQAQVNALRLDDGQTIPSIKQVMTFVCANTMDVVLHLKTLNVDTWPRLADRVAQCPSRVTLMGNVPQMTRAASLVPRAARLVLLSYTPAVWASAAPFDGVAVPEEMVTAGDVVTAHTMGLLFWAYSPRSDRWAAMALAGVDAMFVDDVAGYLGKRL